MKGLCVFLVLLGCVSHQLRAQESPQEQFKKIELLEQQGQLTKLISLIPALISSNSLDRRETGGAWIILGVAYQETGDFVQSQSAYERAIQTFSHEQADKTEYATALSHLGGLYCDMNKPEIAIRLEKKALGIYQDQKLQDAQARSYANLAGLEIYANHRRASKQYLSRATQEAALAGNLGDDFFASLFSIRGWLSEKDGDWKDAVSALEQALVFWKRIHGEDHELTGWGYVLLGVAYAHAGNEIVSVNNLRTGIAILGHTVGVNSPKYLLGEIAYSHMLERSGQLTEGRRLQIAATQGLVNLYQHACTDCRISASALR
jgi:tetratricopeptide (TPR) repeat protein